MTSTTTIADIAIKIAGVTNRGAWTSTPTSPAKVTIPKEYHNGSGYVDASKLGSSEALPVPTFVYDEGKVATNASMSFTVDNGSTYLIVVSGATEQYINVSINSMKGIVIQQPLHLSDTSYSGVYHKWFIGKATSTTATLTTNSGIGINLIKMTSTSTIPTFVYDKGKVASNTSMSLSVDNGSVYLINIESSDGETNINNSINTISGMNITQTIKVSDTSYSNVKLKWYIGKATSNTVTLTAKGGIGVNLIRINVNVGGEISANALFSASEVLTNAIKPTYQADNTYVEGVGYNSFRKISDYRYIYFSLGAGYGGLYDNGVNGPALLSVSCGVISTKNFMNGTEIYVNDGSYWCRVKYQSDTSLLVNSGLNAQRFFLMIGMK